MSAVFCAIIIALGALLWQIYQHQSAVNRAEIEAQLGAIADLKVQEITLWRKERWSDGQMLAHNPLLARQVKWFLQESTREEYREPLRHYLESVREDYDYASISLISPSGQVLMCAGRAPATNDVCEQEVIAEARQSRRVVFTDFFRASPTDAIQLALVAPILNLDVPAARADCLALLVLRMNPERFLYPLIQAWPLPSASAETLLIRRETNAVVFLNELRHRTNTALALSLPLTQTNLPAAQAVLGQTGTLAGVDYRGRPVLASLQPVPHSPWFLVAKVDTEEIFAPLKSRTRWFGFAGLLLIVVTAAGLLVWHSRSRAAFDQHQMEQDRERQALVRHFDYLTKFTNDAITLADAELKFVEVNERACELYGYARAEFLRLHIPDIRAPAAREDLAERLRDPHLANGLLLETIHQRKDGTTFPAAVSMRRIAVEGAQFYQALIRDITEHKRAEEQLHLQAAMLQAAANGIVIADRAGTLLWVNDAFTKLTGYSAAEVIGQNPRVLKSWKQETAFYTQLWETILAGEVWHGELINKRKDGTFYTEEMTITPVRNVQGQVSHFIAIKQDISERQALEASLRQAQKMDSIGRLAGGIAHDFNNILQTILGFTELLLTNTRAEDKRHGDLVEIQKAGQHAADLTQQLLAFSRKQMFSPRVLDLNKALADDEKMLRRLLGEDVRVHLQLANDLPQTMTDPVQIHQIIMNLAINARDAMPNGGDLSISTSVIEFQAQDLVAMPDAQSGRYVCLAVTDTGHGMNHAVQEHIFEPFFTTKGLGKGSGLGLAVIYGIVKQSRGWIHVYSQAGLGTTFKIYLPAHVGEPAPASQAAATDKRFAPAPSKGVRILLVEDEPSVRLLAQRVCLKAGYTVTVCAAAQEALDQWTKTGGAFDMLFSDVVLPDFTGIELAERLRAQRPTLPVLLSSGYSDERSRWTAIAEKHFHYLQKPYPASELSRALAQTLAAPPPA